jgi:hypothetical protein
MLKLDTIYFLERRAIARLENAEGQTVIGPAAFNFSAAAVTLADIRQEIRPQIIVARDSEKTRLQDLVVEINGVDASG